MQDLSALEGLDGPVHVSVPNQGIRHDQRSYQAGGIPSLLGKNRCCENQAEDGFDPSFCL